MGYKDGDEASCVKKIHRNFVEIQYGEAKTYTNTTSYLSIYYIQI